MKAFGGGNTIENYVDCLDYVASLEGEASDDRHGAAMMKSLAVESTLVDWILAYHPDISRKRMMVDQ